MTIMEIKTWHKVLFFGSIAAFVIYKQKNNIKKIAKSNFSDLLTEFANRWKGVVEIGKNAAFQNDVFQAMLKNVGWKSGESWCMYFAKAIHYEVYATERDKINKILNGQTQSSFQNAQNDKTGTYTVSNTPKVGDIAIWTSVSNPAFGHAGLVTKVVDNNKIQTIEGNTSFESAREGDTVESKVRNSKVGSMTGSDLKMRGYIRKIT